MKFEHVVLPTGLEVVGELHPHAQSMAFGFFVRTGARDEVGPEMGVSHFLEHMVFKGDSRYAAEDVNRIFDEIGADYNASTSEETTLFYAAILPEYLETAFDVQSAILRPALRDSDFETEKQVILEEIGMYDDQPSYVAYDNVMQQHFAGHPLGTRVLGTRESITDLTAAQMRQYFDRRYLAGNIVLAATGKIDWPRLVKLAEHHCGHWPRGTPSRTKQPLSVTARTQEITRENQQLSQSMSLSAAPSVENRLRFAADLLTIIVGDDTNSRLFWALVDTGLAEAAEVSYADFDDAGVYMTFLSCTPEERDANVDMIAQIYREVNTQGVTQKELELARNKAATRVVLRGERPMGRLSSLGANWLALREYRSVSDDLEIIRNITLQDIRTLLDQYPLSLTSTVHVGPPRQ